MITEAMAQGTPVITTERTAGPDFIKHGENGWLVNAGSAEAIKIILEEIILHRDIIAEVGKQALETAEKGLGMCMERNWQKLLCSEN